MKRHDALKPLSRDHHLTLKLARRLESSEPVQALQAELKGHVQGLAEHFAAEEAIAERALVTCGRDATLVEQVGRMCREHREIEGLIQDFLGQAPEEPRLSTAQRLGACLAAHVRFEERELFNRLQDGCLGGHGTAA
ncbi:MAG: hemerythrin domain-containing protein [Halothiobacillaceae bacterium]|nr:hemerythrin domain-containing protein [Halothiobacillaceae bacterium]